MAKLSVEYHVDYAISVWRLASDLEAYKALNFFNY